jgi:hypothetical protein
MPHNVRCSIILHTTRNYYRAIFTSADLYKQPAKGRMFKLDKDVEEDVVDRFPQKSKEFFADGTCQHMHFNHP